MTVVVHRPVPPLLIDELLELCIGGLRFLDGLLDQRLGAEHGERQQNPEQTD